MKAFLALSAVFILLLAGCATTEKPMPQPPSNQSNITPPNPDNGTGLANPASVYCKEKGYSLEIRKDATGGEVGYCKFPNGRECEEWAFFRGECTDSDSFELVESPGFVANPKEISYKFYADGRLVLATNYLREGNSSTLMAWLQPSDFAAFVKSAKDAGFESFNSSYHTCGGNAGCPTDMPSMSLRLLSQGNVKEISIYAPADRPESLDGIVMNFKKLFESSTFVDISDSGCRLMKEGRTDSYECFGCPKGITNPKCTEPGSPVFYEVNDSEIGSCTIDAQGACAFQPARQMTKKLCESGRGSWNECGSACRGAPEGTACILMCVQYCECGGEENNGCPAGYFCTDYLPKGAADAMGVCRPLQ